MPAGASGRLAAASCTRFSPIASTPRARISATAAAGWVFDTATSRTPATSRPTRAHAAPIRSRTSRRLSLQAHRCASQEG